MNTKHIIDPFSKRSLGRSGLQVPQLGFGGGTPGDPVEVILEEQAQQTLTTTYRHRILRYSSVVRTGLTQSEHRIGYFLRQKPRESFVINTKVGRVFSRPDDRANFSQDRWAGGLPFQLRFDYTRDGFIDHTRTVCNV